MALSWRATKSRLQREKRCWATHTRPWSRYRDGADRANCQIVLELPAFPRRAETRDRRRRERQPCRRQDPGARAARGREDPAARLCAVSGTRNVHALRRHAGCARQRPIDARIRAIFEQSQHAPLRLAEEVALVLALQGGVLDAIPPGAIAGFHSGLRAALDRDLPDAVRQVQQTGALHEANKPAVLATLRAYSKRFAQTAGRPV